MAAISRNLEQYGPKFCTALQDHPRYVCAKYYSDPCKIEGARFWTKIREQFFTVAISSKSTIQNSNSNLIFKFTVEFLFKLEIQIYIYLNFKFKITFFIFPILSFKVEIKSDIKLKFNFTPLNFKL